MDDRISRKRKEIDELDSSLVKKHEEEVELSAKLTELKDDFTKTITERDEAKKVLDGITSQELFKKKMRLAKEIEDKEKKIADLDEKHTEYDTLVKQISKSREELKGYETSLSKQVLMSSIQRLLDEKLDTTCPDEVDDSSTEETEDSKCDEFEREQVYRFKGTSLSYRGKKYQNKYKYIDGTNSFSAYKCSTQPGYGVTINCSSACFMSYHLWIDGKFINAGNMKKFVCRYTYKKKITVKISKPKK